MNLLSALREPTKLINSLRLSARATGTRLRDVPVVATSNCGIERHRTARLEIDGRLYLGCFVPAVGRIAARSAATEIRLAESAVMRCEGTVQLGPGVRITVGPRARLVIGDGTYVTCDSVIIAASSVSIGAGCAISWGVQILDTNFHKPLGDPTGAEAVTIEDRVWIASNVTILKGIRVGSGSIVAAGAVVTKNVPARSLVAGVPARIIRSDVDWS
jgi:acetyltransferase-like isoleucine patch superfamily enzyme